MLNLLELSPKDKLKPFIVTTNIVTLPYIKEEECFLIL